MIVRKLFFLVSSLEKKQERVPLDFLIDRSVNLAKIFMSLTKEIELAKPELFGD